MKKDRIVTLTDIVFLIILSITLLLVLNIDNLFRIISGDANEAYVYVHENVSGFTEKAGDFISSALLTPDVATFILWGIIGFIAYVLVGLFLGTGQDIGQEISVSKRYMHPRDFNKGSFWKDFLIHSAIVLVFVVVSITWTIWFLNKFIPLSSSSLYLATEGFFSPLATVGYLGLAFISIFTGLLGFLVIARIMKVIKTNFIN